MPGNAEDTSIEPEPVGETAQEREAEELANRVMRRAASLKGVKIDRGVFLRAELKKHFPEIDADSAVATTPIEAGLAPRDLDELALDVIDFEVKKCAALSFAAGVPGGFAMAGTVPADLAQYFAHVMRVEQKLAYLYGWHSFLNDEDEVDDETIAQLVMLMGVMLGVGGAANAVSQFAATTARHGIAKQVERQALTKTFFYNPLKKVLSFLGVKMTKQTFSKAVTKAVPVFGGAISGGLTYVSFKPEAERLRRYLRKLPLSGIDEILDPDLAVVRAELHKAAQAETLEQAKQIGAAALEGAGDALVAGAGSAARIAGGAVRVAGGAAQAANEAAGRALGAFAGKFGNRAKKGLLTDSGEAPSPEG